MTRWLLVVACLVGCSSAGEAAHDAGANDAGTDAPTLEAFGDCARCHTRIAADHAASMHAQAFDDPLFQREWSVRHRASCVGCHAPAADDANDPRAHQGVGCASCHVANGAIVSLAVSGRAPHPSVADPHLRDPERCGACHEFDFSNPHGRPERMQRTLSEWRTAARDETCADCHMPAGTHRLRGPRDPDLLADSLSIDVAATREPRGTVVRATLRVAGAGHAVPTGDLNRNLVLSAWRGDGEPVSAELSRLFGRGEEGEPIEIADQRVLPGIERRLALVLPPGRGAVHWSLVWNALPTDQHAEAIEISLRTREIASGTTRVTLGDGR